MTLWYLTSLTYPSTLANRLQVMKMTEAFSRHADTTLWVASMGGKKKEVLVSYGISDNLSIKELPISSGILWPQSFFRALTFRRIVREAPPETFFYTRDLLLAFFLSLLSPRFRGNFFFECHSLDKASSLMYRQVFRSARRVISTNKAKADVIVRIHGIDTKRILVAPNGFDAKIFDGLPPRSEVRTSLGLPADQSIVLYAGSLQSWKGTDVVRALAEALPHVLFVVLGTKEDQKENNLWMMRAVPNRAVPSYLRAADVLIAPYRADSLRAQSYFSPIKIMEYLASGTPVVATDLASIREIAGDEELFFVQEYRVEEFERVIREVLSNPTEGARHAQRGQAYVQKYSWVRRAENIVAFLRAQ